MTLAQVQAAVAVVVALIGTWTGLLMAVALLLPLQTGRAENALLETPKRCFGIGLLMLLVAVLGGVLIQIPNPLAKLAGAVVMLLLGVVLSVGAAGMAQVMGRRMAEMSGARTSFGMLVRGSLCYSLAVFFPYLGWFLFAPIASVCALGAGISALGRRRLPAASAPRMQEAVS